MQCSSPGHSQWMLCVWTSPQLAKICVLNMDNKYSQVCNDTSISQTEKKYVVIVKSHSCDLTFKAGEKDHGIWSCMLTTPDHETLTTVTYTDLSVVLHPSIKISIENGRNDNGTVLMKSGEWQNVTCTGHREYPRSEVTWFLQTNSSHVTINQYQEPYTVSHSNYFYSSKAFTRCNNARQ